MRLLPSRRPSMAVSRLVAAAAAACVAAALPRAAHAAPIVDPLGDFLASYTGLRGGDLDVLTAEVFLDPGVGFRFTSTSAAALGATPGALFVWGVDRGQGTQGFPVIAPGVRFDAVVVLNPTGQSFVRDLVAGVNFNLPAGALTVNGAFLSGAVPLAALPSLGLQPAAYTVNLWPRTGLGNDALVADFAPDNSNAAVTVTPEPATWLLLAGALGPVLALARRRRA